jgi:hypothetical protein
VASPVLYVESFLRRYKKIRKKYRLRHYTYTIETNSVCLVDSYDILFLMHNVIRNPYLCEFSHL